jgi:hypothetical protein
MAVSRPIIVPFRETPRTRFLAFRARIRMQAMNTIVLGDTGSATGEDGLKLSWIYDEAAQTLTVTCVERAWFQSAAWVEKRIRGVVEAL